jgi:hypothetical protein
MLRPLSISPDDIKIMKMSIISTIQMLESKARIKSPHSFQELWASDYMTLELIRDWALVQYNDSIRPQSLFI